MPNVPVVGVPSPGRMDPDLRVYRDGPKPNSDRRLRRSRPIRRRRAGITACKLRRTGLEGIIVNFRGVGYRFSEARSRTWRRRFTSRLPNFPRSDQRLREVQRRERWGVATPRRPRRRAIEVGCAMTRPLQERRQGAPRGGRTSTPVGLCDSRRPSRSPSGLERQRAKSPSRQSNQGPGRNLSVRDACHLLLSPFACFFSLMERLPAGWIYCSS